MARSSRFTGTIAAHECNGPVTHGILAVVRRRVRVGFWYRLVVVVAKPLLRLFTKRDRGGADNVPSSGGIIVVANHVSEIDPFVVGEFLFDLGRPPRFLAKKELFRKAPLRWILDGAGQIPVDRNTTDAGKSLVAAIDALQRGECILVYPEGSATRDPELWPMRPRTGAARLALMSGVPVIPVAQWGPEQILPYKARRPKLLPRKTMTVRAGAPVDLSRFRDRPVTAELLYEASDAIMRSVANLLAEIRGGTPPEKFHDPRATTTLPESA